MPNTTEERLPSDDVTPGEARRADARRYLQQRQVFRVHAVVFAVSMALIVLVNLLVNLVAGIAGEWAAWWSLWALLGWGAGLVVHGLVLGLERARLVAESDEERRIDALLS